MTYTKFGEKPKQEPIWTGPLEKKRSYTDVPFIIGFGVFIVFWIAIAIYAFCAGDSVNFFFHPVHMYHRDFIYMAIFFHHNIDEARFYILGFLAWSVLLLIVFALLFRWTTKIFVFITIGLSFILVLILYGLLFYSVDINEVHPIMILPIAVITGFYGLMIYAFVKAGTKIVCKVIKESCKAMFFFPSTLVLGVMQFILQLIIAIFTSYVYMYLTSIRIPEDGVENSNMTTSSENEVDDNSTSAEDHWFYDDPYFYENSVVPHYIYFFHLVNYFGFFWATWFIMGLGRMVLTATFATWYQAKDKSSIPLMLIPKCFMMIISQHSGTLAYASSPLTILPMFYIVWKYGLDKLKEMYKRPILILSWLTILMQFSFDAMTMCAIHGNTFYKSAKESYILFMKHPVSYLAINTVSEYVIVLGTLLLPTLSFFSVFGYCWVIDPESISHQARATAIMVVTMTSLLMSVTFFMVFRSASNTVRYCYLEDSKFNNEAEMNLYEVHVDDMSIHDVDQDP